VTQEVQVIRRIGQPHVRREHGIGRRRRHRIFYEVEKPRLVGTGQYIGNAMRMLDAAANPVNRGYCSTNSDLL
jgi:hypothetical protein